MIDKIHNAQGFLLPKFYSVTTKVDEDDNDEKGDENDNEND